MDILHSIPHSQSWKRKLSNTKITFLFLFQPRKNGSFGGDFVSTNLIQICSISFDIIHFIECLIDFEQSLYFESLKFIIELAHLLIRLRSIELEFRI